MLKQISIGIAKLSPLNISYIVLSNVTDSLILKKIGILTEAYVKRFTETNHFVTLQCYRDIEEYPK